MNLPIDVTNVLFGDDIFELPTDHIPTTAFATCVVLLVILCVIGKYLTIIVPALAIILFFVQSHYLRVSRLIQLLDIEAKAKSPLLTHFVETMQEISAIRAMRWQVAL